MHIPLYQIRNVLSTYRKHLCEGATEKHGPGFANPYGQNINKAARGRRQGIIKMVDADVFDKINQFCTRLNADGKTDLQVQMASEKPVELKHDRKTQFVFNVIDENNEKSCHSISVKDTNFFLKGLEAGKNK